MKTRVLLLAGTLAACAAPPSTIVPRQAVELAGRSAGSPQRCVPIKQSEALRVSDVDRHTLIYGSGRTVYANHLGASCGFAANDVLVTEPLGSFYCRGDLVRSIDSFTRIPGPSCILSDFVPYTR